MGVNLAVAGGVCSAVRRGPIKVSVAGLEQRSGVTRGETIQRRQGARRRQLENHAWLRRGTVGPKDFAGSSIEVSVGALNQRIRVFTWSTEAGQSGQGLGLSRSGYHRKNESEGVVHCCTVIIVVE